MDAMLADPLAGQVLDGRYRVESRVARGGMATVYVATDTRLDRTVALKIMHRELASDADFVRRFIGEAKSVARLSHPNVVAVFDQGSDGEYLYLAMEYVPGRTLRDLLNERGRLAPGEALDVMVPVLAGLGAAHQAGFVHRDVKPENVLLAADWRVKVVDFGLARAVAEARQTKTGMVIGTAAYLAPEQVTRAAADARTDVYAAGVMLFELVTGQQPHTGGTPLDVAHKHVSETVPAPSRLVPGLAPAVDAVVALATSRNPDLRPGDAGQLLHAVIDARRRLPGGTAFAPGPAGRSPGQPGTFGAPGKHRVSAPPSGPGSWPGRNGPPGTVPGPGGPPAGAFAPAPGGPPPGAFAAPPAGPPSGAFPAAGPPPGGAGPQQSAVLGVPGVPGLAALPAFGPVHPDGTAASSGAGPRGQQATVAGQQAGQNNTLVVSGGHGDHGGHGGPPLRERGIGSWLFSRRLAYLAGALAVVLLIGLVTWWQTDGRYTRVPDVAGLTTTTAAAELRNAGFSVTVAAPQPDNQTPKGQVSRTVPAIGGRVLKGSAITVIPSAGPRMIAVPNVTGKAVADARGELRAAGLTPGAVQQQTSPTVPQGEVISTDPPPGTLWPQPRPVAIVVSAGIGLPDFTGQPKDVAEQWLQQHQLQVQEQPATSSSQPQDSVVQQSPAAGTPITQGEVVTLDVSTGPPMVQIPNVTGMSAQDAQNQLQQLGFQVSVTGFGNGNGNGQVIAYSPTGQAPKGTTITLVVGFGP
jgi:eukaryotic-like serine/threonine-protein kinase